MRKLEPWLGQGYKVQGAYLTGKTLIGNLIYPKMTYVSFPQSLAYCLEKEKFSLGKRGFRI